MLYIALRWVTFAMMCFITSSSSTSIKVPENYVFTPQENTDIEANEKLLLAIIYVESRGDSTRWAKGEDAVGCLQIRKIAVRDANRILRKRKTKKRYKYKDRWNCEKSKEMFAILTNYYLPGGCNEDIARFWNGGPRRPIKESTEKYWRKVRRKLYKMAKQR